MSITRAISVFVIVIFSVAVLLLGGCQSQSLAACKAENAELTKKVFDLDEKLASEKADMENAGTVMGNVFIDLDAKEKRIAELEKANAELTKANEELNAKLNGFPDSSKRLIKGVEEIRKAQREAAAKLKAEQAVADANKPK
jgi:chromosome segregation ATPase